MSVICDDELDEFIAKCIDSPVPLDHDGVFVDITLDNIIKYEIDDCPAFNPYREIEVGKDSLSMEEHDLVEEGNFLWETEEFVMGLSQQFFRMPDDVIGTLYLRSTEARVGIQHSVALPIKRNWEGKLQLEMVNSTQYHLITLKNGMKIGQVKFERVGGKGIYEGKFNNQTTVTCNGSDELSSGSEEDCEETPHC
jgi:deoxycytidine triphosphate deaminase